MKMLSVTTITTVVYVFYHLDPVEVNIDGDSIDLEMRIVEGEPATISHVRINGNDRLYENIVRRELRTRPGDLFSREALERSYREIAQMGHFNPENIQMDVQPNQTDGTGGYATGDWSQRLTTRLSSLPVGVRQV